MLDKNGKFIFDSVPEGACYFSDAVILVVPLYTNLRNVSAAMVRDNENWLIMTGNLDADL